MEETKKGDKPKEFTLTKEQEAEMFKSLTHKSYKEVGYELGLNLIYPDNDIKVTTTISNIAKRIKKAPELWNLSKDVVEVVQASLDKRNIKKNPGLKSDVEIQEESFRDKLDMIRDRTADIISKKLKGYEKKGGHKDVSIRDLKDLVSMAIDKSRLLRGESTENIKKLSTINVDDMSAEDALKVILKARSVLIEGKK